MPEEKKARATGKEFIKQGGKIYTVKEVRDVASELAKVVDMLDGLATKEEAKLASIVDMFARKRVELTNKKTILEELIQ